MSDMGVPPPPPKKPEPDDKTMSIMGPLVLFVFCVCLIVLMAGGTYKVLTMMF